MSDKREWMTGREYYERFKTANPGLELRQRPPDNATVDEYGNEPNYDGCLIVGYIVLMILVPVVCLIASRP